MVDKELVPAHKAELIQQVYVALRDLDRVCVLIHKLNEDWWKDIETGERIERNKGEMISLMHSELSELLEAERKYLQSDKLDGFNGNQEEIADVIIRLCDYIGGHKIPSITETVVEKLRYNAIREDHKLSIRAQVHGKKY